MNKILTTAYLKSNLGNEYMKSICEIYVANKKARDGQDTAKRDFSLTKTMKFTLPKNGAQTREIIIKYGLPKSDASYFNIDLSHVGTSKEEYKEKIKSKISKQMYYRDLKID